MEIIIAHHSRGVGVGVGGPRRRVASRMDGWMARGGVGVGVAGCIMTGKTDHGRGIRTLGVPAARARRAATD